MGAVNAAVNGNDLNAVAYLAADGTDPPVSNGEPINPTYYSGTVFQVPEDAQFGDTFKYKMTVDCTTCAP